MGEVAIATLATAPSFQDQIGDSSTEIILETTTQMMMKIQNILLILETL